jgi:hypothetical protein
MAVTAKGFNSFFQGLVRGRFAFQTDTFKIALVAAANAPTAENTVLANLTQIAGTDNGYTTGGVAIAGNTMAVARTTTVTQVGDGTDDLTFTQAGANALGPFRYAVLLRSGTVDSVTDPLVAMLDYGQDITLTSGASFEINAGTDGWVKFTMPAWA